VPQVEIPRRYRGPTQGVDRVEVAGHTVRQCLEEVEARHPGFLELVVDRDGDVRRFVRLFKNGEELLDDALDEPLGSDDRIEIVAATAGG
jgi:sulfur carrier protein ThiS